QPRDPIRSSVASPPRPTPPSLGQMRQPHLATNRHHRARRILLPSPANTVLPRHGKAVFRPDRPTSSTSATYVRTPQPRPQTNPELRNLDPNRTITPSFSFPFVSNS